MRQFMNPECNQSSQFNLNNFLQESCKLFSRLTMRGWVVFIDEISLKIISQLQIQVKNICVHKILSTVSECLAGAG